MSDLERLRQLHLDGDITVWPLLCREWDRRGGKWCRGAPARNEPPPSLREWATDLIFDFSPAFVFAGPSRCDAEGFGLIPESPSVGHGYRVSVSLSMPDGRPGRFILLHAFELDTGERVIESPNLECLDEFPDLPRVLTRCARLYPWRSFGWLQLIDSICQRWHQLNCYIIPSGVNCLQETPNPASPSSPPPPHTPSPPP